MIEEKDLKEWKKKGNRLNVAWAVTLALGIALVVMAAPFSHGFSGFKHLWTEDPIKALISVIGIMLVAAGNFFNWKFRQHLRKAL